MVQSIDKKNEPRNPDSLDAELLQAIAIMPQDIKIAVLDYAEYLIDFIGNKEEISPKPFSQLRCSS